MLGEVKTNDEQTHVHANFWRCTYMQPSSIGMMAELAVETPSVRITATLEVDVAATLFIVPNSLLSFNLQGNGFMKIV